MRAPLLSIVTISFNQKEFLEKTIESVLMQKTDEVEYIVVDPGSTDGSLELIGSYKKQIDHVVLGPDRGPAHGLNNGFAMARGKVGVFLNSDDFLMPKAIASMANFWRENHNFDLLLCGGWMVDERGNPMRELQVTSQTLSSLVNAGGNMFQQGMSFRMEAFRKIGGFNETNRSCWDFELLCGLMENGAAQVSRERIGAFRLHGASLTGGAAGTTHQARYEADRARIITRYGEKRPHMAMNVLALISLQRALHRYADILVPSRMQSRFSSDSESL
jgi:glycosyltransferase involved in cell wall biosynthesis